MTDYKNTLNLPQTDFPMKANLSQREPDILERWESASLYAIQRHQRAGKPKFILHLGPPYANGHIHLGTAATTILKDMIVKSKSLYGFDAPLVPGWDCHGLPIELNVEKKIGKPGKQVSATEFRVACREYATHYIDIQRNAFKRLGIIADWNHPYLTMDFKYEANIVRSLAKMIEKGHVQKGYKPVHWCLDCASALAEAEVEYADKKSPAIDVRFKVVDKEAFIQLIDPTLSIATDLVIPIWTTTPWSLPGNQAVALNPYLNYVLVAYDNKECLVIAEDLLSSVLSRYGIEHYQVLAKTRGETFVSQLLQHPFYDKTVPIILGEHVTIDAGTGAVHTAPAHGIEDFMMGKQYHLPMDNPVGDDGCFTANTPLFAGLHVNKANSVIIDLLKEKGALIKEEVITHSYPHCWRHKTAVIFRATPQWFISMDKNQLRQQTLASINRVEWIPDWGKARITGMIENRPDWCISRQRVWGVPITLFIHKETNELHPNTLTLMEKIANQIEKEGIEAWYRLDEFAWLGDEAHQYQKISDVLDVWFDSGVSHECVLKVRPELKFPADIVLEGSDQHRGWFQSSILTSIAINEKEPFKAVLTHGFVVDAKGHKMSKSIGNVIAPEEVVKTLGADILRLWVASIDYRYEMTASNEILTRTSETYRRIRNTMRFMLANLNGFDPKLHLLPERELLALDQFMVDRVKHLQAEILDAYDTYQFHQVVQKLHHFCVSDLGGFYLDIIKDRQYTMALNSNGRRSAQTALYHLTHALVRSMAPILSFTAEEIWQHIPGKDCDSIFLTTWYEKLASLPTDEEMNKAYWDKIKLVREAVNKEIENLRNAGTIGSALEAVVYLYCAPHLKELLDALENELRFVLITSEAKVIAEHAAPLDRVVTEVPGLALKIEATKEAKCERCWHRRPDVNENPDYPGICSRCVENITGRGEKRLYA